VKVSNEHTNGETFPLPKAITEKVDLSNLKAPNLSLRYYKLAIDFRKADDKKNFLTKFTNLQAAEYTRAFETRKKMLDRIGDGFTLTTATRLLFGIGYQHPLKIGFMFDWTTGLPIIPGSSLKGIARDYARNNRDQWDDGLMEKIFGPKDNANAHVGAIIFLPAFPCPDDGQKLFEPDVMTPHYTLYYTDPGKNPPADWYNPVPIPFLTVPAGVRYCFRIADRTNLGKKENDSALLKEAKTILRSALIDHGVGAKTSVDYGYFK
jgi:CRISPR-associated protein Cmr6